MGWGGEPRPHFLRVFFALTLLKNASIDLVIQEQLKCFWEGLTPDFEENCTDVWTGLVTHCKLAKF